jgi:hypothetical protein
MSERLLTDRELQGLLRRLTLLEQRVGRVEVIERAEYLTGSFAPALVGSGTAGTFTYGSGNLVEWTRNGNRLFVNGRVQITATAVAPVGNLSITGWPYAGVSDANMAIAGVGACEWRNVTFAANYLSIAVQWANGTTAATLVKSGTAGVNVVALTGAELGGGVYDFRFGGHYRIA